MRPARTQRVRRQTRRAASRPALTSVSGAVHLENEANEPPARECRWPDKPPHPTHSRRSRTQTRRTQAAGDCVRRRTACSAPVRAEVAALARLALQGLQRLQILQNLQSLQSPQGLKCRCDALIVRRATGSPAWIAMARSQPAPNCGRNLPISRPAIHSGSDSPADAPAAGRCARRGSA